MKSLFFFDPDPFRLIFTEFLLTDLRVEVWIPLSRCAVFKTPFLEALSFGNDAIGEGDVAGAIILLDYIKAAHTSLYVRPLA